MNSRENQFSNKSTGQTNASEDIEEYSDIRKALPQFLAVGAKNILLFGYGLTIGFPTIVIPAIQGGQGHDSQHGNGLQLSKDEISWFSSINLLCVPLGCVFSGMIAQPIGKRMAMQIVNIPILMSWLLFHFSTSIYHLYAALCLAGLSGGLMEAAVLTYVAEITQPQYRGMLAASGSTCVILGVFTQFLLATVSNWRAIALICTIFPIVSIFTLFFVPESPYWLLTKGQLDSAHKSLAWLRGWTSLKYVQSEFNEMCDVLIPKLTTQSVRMEESEPQSWIEKRLMPYKKRSFLIPYALVTYTFFVEHFSGKTSLQTYAVQIFHTLKAPIDKYYATVLLGAAELIGTLICAFLVHFTGKRPLVLISAIGCGIGFLGTATYTRFLDLVPGVTVENIVANLSALDLNKSNLITSQNITPSSSLSPATTEKIFHNIGIGESPDNLHYRRILSLRDVSNAVRRLDIETTIFNDYFDETTPTDFGLSANNDTTELNIILDSDLFDEMSFNQTDFDDSLSTNETQTDAIEDSEPDENNDIVPPHIVLQVPKVNENRYLWIPLTLLIISALFSHIGLRLIPWMLIGEVFPASIRSGASGISGATGYVFGFLANKLFLRMLTTLTLPGTFWFYSIVGLSGAAVLYFLLPETEGRSLLEIEEHFSGIKSLDDRQILPKNGASHDTERSANEMHRSTKSTNEDNFDQIEIYSTRL